MRINRVIFLLVDGLSASLFQDLINKGRMPYIEKYLINRGIYSGNCLSCFPANTAPAHLSHLTGSYIDRHGIPLIKYWSTEKGKYLDFTKSSLSAIENLNKNISNDVKTIYEYFTGRTTSLHFVNRGASDIYAGKLRSIFLYVYSRIYGWNKLHRLAIKVALERLSMKDPSKIIVIWLPGPDAISHNLGPTSSVYIKNVRNLDEQVRFLVEGDRKISGLRDLNIFDDSLIILSSDHGEMEVKHNCPIEDYFKEMNLNVLAGQSTPQKIDEANVLMAISGGVALLNFKDQKTGLWRINKENLQNFNSDGQITDILGSLKEMKGVERVYLKQNPNIYHISSKEGESLITRKRKLGVLHYKYEVISGRDPLVYDKHKAIKKMMRNKYFPVYDWRNVTRDTDTPEIIDQIPRVFDCSDTTFSVLVSCSPNYSFKKNHKGEHDIESKEIRHVPFIMAWSKGKIHNLGFLRIVDILPTVLDLLSIDYTMSDIDGKSLIR